ncbi:MAG: 23S rRNA (uracil(1939)-C(5))-methyltransferase RlmD [Faecalibacillus sp.]
MKATVEIKKLGINGEGIGYIHRKVCFVKGAIVGEIVEVEAKQQNNKNFYIGELIKIKKKSPARVESSCRLNQCQGCQLLHMSYEAQLKHKKELIKESIHKYSGIDLSYVQFHDVIGLNQKEHFLMNADLPIVEFKGKLTFGIYQRESQFLTIMTHCMKHHPLIHQTLWDLEDILNKYECKTYNDKLRKGLRFIKIRVLQDKVQLVFITGIDGLKTEVIEEIKALKHVNALFMSINTSKYQDFEVQGYKKIFGNMKNEFVYDNHKYLVSIKSHLPHNLEAYQIINKVIKTMVKDSHKIISLNSQLGILELSLDQEVIAIDDKKEHIDDAKYNARVLQKENVKFVYGNIESKMIQYAKKKEYDTLIIQNDKNSIPENLIDTLRQGKVETVIYVSISPSTMAKDIQELSKYYHVKEIKPVDSHLYQSYVTSVVKLVRK